MSKTRALLFGNAAQMTKVWLALNALDMLTTHVALQLGAVEANPIVAGLIARSGEAVTYSLKLLLVLAVAALLYKTRRLLLFNWLNLGMGLVIVSNIGVLTYSLSG